jgi:hypothetical protein
MEMEIDSPSEKYVDTGHYITERYCTESTCKFGCKHDGHYIRSRAEREHNCRFGNVQKQRNGKKYDCISHDNCPVRLRIYFKQHKIYSTITPIEHSDATLLAERGIQHMWRVEVDRYIEVDMNPSQIYQKMQQLASSSMQQYAHLIPSLHQISNRKKRLKANTVQQHTFTYNDLIGYVSGGTNQDWQSACSISELDDKQVMFVDLVTPGEQSGHKCTCVTFTNKAMLLNLQQSLHHTGNKLIIFSDATHSITDVKWKLIVIGTISLCLESDGSPYHTLTPLMFGFSDTESEESYTICYNSINTLAKKFLNVERIQIAYSMQDACLSSCNALDAVYNNGRNGITHLTCWFHVLQNVQRKLKQVAPNPSNKTALKRKADIIDSSVSQSSQIADTQSMTIVESLTASQIEQQIRELHYAQSPHIFRLLWSVLQCLWKNDSNTKISDWGQTFAEQYVDRSATNKWYIGCDMGSDDDIPLALTNNVVESFNSSFKSAINPKVEINTFFKGTIREYLQLLTHTTDLKRLTSYVHIPKDKQLKFIQTHKIPDEILKKTKDIISSRNTDTYYDDSRHAIYINSGRYTTLPVTSDRVNIFESALNGTLAIQENTSWNEVLKMTSSLHKVSIITFLCPETNTTCRRCKCTCKVYKKSSFICSHVLFSYHELKLFDVNSRETSIKPQESNSTKYVSVIIGNRVGLIPSSIKLQKMNDSALIQVHFSESEVQTISVSEIRKGMQDLAKWTQETFVKTPANKRQKK